MWLPELLVCLHLHTDLEAWPSHVHSARFNYVWITVTAVKGTSVSPLCCAILLEVETSEFLTFWEPSCYLFPRVLNRCQRTGLSLLIARRCVVATLWIRLPLLFSNYSFAGQRRGLRVGGGPAVRKGKVTYFTGWMLGRTETDRISSMSVQGRQWLRVGNMNCSHLNASWHADGYAIASGVQAAQGSSSDVGLVTRQWEKCMAETAHYTGGRKPWSGPECGTWVSALQPPLMEWMRRKSDGLPNQTWPWESHKALFIDCLLHKWAVAGMSHQALGLKAAMWTSTVWYGHFVRINPQCWEFSNYQRYCQNAVAYGGG